MNTGTARPSHGGRVTRRFDPWNVAGWLLIVVVLAAVSVLGLVVAAAWVTRGAGE